jgi:hypothetical protein
MSWADCEAELSGLTERGIPFDGKSRVTPVGESILRDFWRNRRYRRRNREKLNAAARRRYRKRKEKLRA